MKQALFTSLFLLLFTSSIIAQSDADWKYKAYPDLPFKLNHIEMDLTIDQEAFLVKGAATYTITSRRPALSELVFTTSGLDVKEVSSGGNELSFRVSSDSLIIELADTLHNQESTGFLIAWESSSPYGIHADVNGNMWTSLNPGMRHHWLPIPDHPEVTTTLDAEFIIPAEQEVVFNGSFMEDEIVSAEQKKVRWASETEIPVSGISFAVGSFQKESARSGVKEVSISASENAVVQEVRNGLLSIAVESLKEYESTFSFEFPYEALNIVVLPDHYWEEVQSGSGIIYLYQNLGSLSTQLKRGIAEQWLGNYHRYLDIPDARYEFLKVLVTGTYETEPLSNSGGLTSIEGWNSWEKGVENLGEEFLLSTVKSSLAELIQQFEGVTGWEDYADFWYKQTGAYWNSLPEPETTRKDAEEGYIYDVEYIYDEMNSALTLVFNAQSEPISSLVGVKVMQYGFMDTTQSEISFTGEIDSVEVDITSGLEYITLNPETDLKLELEEQKPFLFLIQQLRSSDPDTKIQAALQLRAFTENPDLQLALQDVLEGENNPEVRAALLGTLSEITKGASGTEQNFLDQLNAESLSTQLSAVRALANYPDNEQVAYAIRNVMLRTDSDTLFQVGLNTYQQLVSAEQLLTLTERLERSGGKADQAILVLSVAAEMDTSRSSLSVADRIALGAYPYTVKKRALNILIDQEENPEYWAQTIGLLLDDRDPRIRYHALDAITYLSPKNKVEVLVSRAEEEMDPRVLQRIRNLMRRAQ